MTVGELIELLQDYDPEAQVLLMAQQSYPFENDLAGVCARADLEAVRDDREDEAGVRRHTDVFLVEGSQLRYGSKRAWEAV